MDHYPSIQMKCSEDADMLQRFVERERIVWFFVGLNVEFDLESKFLEKKSCQL